MEDNTNYFEVNKATWNKKVAVHAQSEMYNMEAFKSGKSSLMPYELKALGDVDRKVVIALAMPFWSRYIELE